MTSVKALEKRQTRALSTSDFYAYEQATRTLFHRLSTPASPPDSHLLAITSTLSAAKTLNTHDQTTPGASLALLALRHLSDRGIYTTPGTLDSVRGVLSSFPPVGEASNREKLRVAKAAVKWTAAAPGCGEFGDEGLSVVAGRAAEACGAYAEAVRYLIRGNEPGRTAACLVAWCGSEGVPSERDLFLTRAVLQYLVAENVGDAEALRVEFCKNVGWEERSEETPCLVGFCEAAVVCARIGRSAKGVWEKVVAVYGKALAVDEKLEGLVARIGEMYFGIAPPAPQGMAGMMQGMMRGMMAG